MVGMPTAGGGFDVGDLVARLRIEASGFDQGLQEAKGNLAGFAQEVAKGFGMSAENAVLLTESLSGIVVGIAAVEAASLSAAMAASEWADRLKDLALYTGLSTQSLERLKAICIGTTLEFDTLTMNFTFFQKTLGRADSDTKPIIEALHKLGISVKDANGNLRSTDELIPLAIAALNKIENPAERAGLAMAMFGKESKEVLKMASQSPEELQKLSDGAKVHADKTLEMAEKFKIKMDTLQASFDSIWREVGLKLIPVMEEDLLPLFGEVADFFEYISPLIEYAARGFHILGMTLISVGDMLGSLMMAFQAVMAGKFDVAASIMTDSFGRVRKTFLDYRDQWQKDWDEEGKARLAVNNMVAGSNWEAGKSAEFLGKEYALTAKEAADLAIEQKGLRLDLRQYLEVDLPKARNLQSDLSKDRRKDMEQSSAEYKAWKIEMADANLAIEKINNQISDTKTKLGEAILETKAAAQTINEWLSSIGSQAVSEPTMGVGYGEAGGLSIEELRKKMADVKAVIDESKGTVTSYGLGMSQNEQDQYARYIKILKDKQAAIAAKPEAKAETAAKDPVAAQKEQTKGVTDAIAKENAGVKELYIEREKLDKTHWTALTEMMRLSLENMTTAWKTYVEYAAKFPTIHNIGIVVWNRGIPDWSPTSNPIFMQTARMAELASFKVNYAAVDFSALTFTGGDEKKKEDKNVTINQQITVNTGAVTSPQQIVDAEVKASKTLAGAAYTAVLF